MPSCQNNLEKFYTEKKTKHITSGYTWRSIRSLKSIEKFCKDIREHALEIINYDERKMIPLTDKETQSYGKQNFCYICRKEFTTDKKG